MVVQEKGPANQAAPNVGRFVTQQPMGWASWQISGAVPGGWSFRSVVDTDQDQSALAAMRTDQRRRFYMFDGHDCFLGFPGLSGDQGQKRAGLSDPGGAISV